MLYMGLQILGGWHKVVFSPGFHHYMLCSHKMCVMIIVPGWHGIDHLITVVANRPKKGINQWASAGGDQDLVCIVFQTLEVFCELVVEENKRRSDTEKKLYVMFDQMYWHLTYDGIEHYDPVNLNPEMRNYTVYIDAISKVFASTGVRVGWSLGPAFLLNKMKAILSHVGAWAPMAEQKALTKFLGQKEAINTYLTNFKSELEERLRRT